MRSKFFAMKEVELEVADLHCPKIQGDAFNLVLKEKNGNRFVPILIGLNEAKSIILEVNHIKLKRPFAHDLVLQLCEKNDCFVQKVVINHFHDGIYYVHIYILRKGEVILLDSRVSDAVVIALKSDAPILMTEVVFNQTSYDNYDELSPDFDFSELVSKNNMPHSFNDASWREDGVKASKPLKDCTLSELKALLAEAVDEENYEFAAEIDAELNRRPDYGKQ